MNARAHPTIEPAAPVFPPIYGMILNLNGRAVDGYEEGDVLEIDTRFLPDVGDLVCVHLRNGHCYMMTTEMALPAKMWSQMPYRENPGSEIHALFVGRVLGDPDPRLRTLKLEDCWAIHVCTGKLDQGDEA